MRLFVALQIPVDVREALSDFMRELREITGLTGRAAPRWVRMENVHVTLKFIGEVAPQRVDIIRAELSKIRSDQSIGLEFHGLGFFPAEKAPRVLWAGIKTTASLQVLANEIEAALEKVEIPREQRTFTPHLTLARFESPGIAELLRTAIQKNPARNFGSCTTNEFHLIESKLKPSGAEYTTMQTFRFALAEA